MRILLLLLLSGCFGAQPPAAMQEFQTANLQLLSDGCNSMSYLMFFDEGTADYYLPADYRAKDASYLIGIGMPTNREALLAANIQCETFGVAWFSIYIERPGHSQNMPTSSHDFYTLSYLFEGEQIDHMEALGARVDPAIIQIGQGRTLQDQATTWEGGYLRGNMSEAQEFARADARYRFWQENSGTNVMDVLLSKDASIGPATCQANTWSFAPKLEPCSSTTFGLYFEDIQLNAIMRKAP